MKQRAVHILVGVVSLGAAMAAFAGAQQPSATAPAERAKRHVTGRVDANEAMKVTVVLEGLDSLVRSLSQSRALEERIGMALREYGTQSDVTRRHALEEQLQKLAEKNVQLMSRIQLACTYERASERAPEGYLGVTFSMSGTTKRESNGPEVFRFEEPPEVISVEPGSPADRAGMRRGDHILALDGREVVGRDVILSQMLVPGRRLPLRLAREDKEMEMAVLVAKRPGSFGDQCTDLDLAFVPMRPPVPGQPPRAFTFVRPPSPPRAGAAPAAPEPPAAPSVWTFDAPPPVAMSGFASFVAGAQVTTLTDDFKELTGARGGVMVQRVVRDTPAAAAGLRGGDVIVEAGARPLTSARLLQRMVGENNVRTLKLKVVRKGKARTVWLKW